MGTLIEKILSSIGITQERLKRFFGIEDCGCENRKNWLNKIFSRNKEID